MADTNSSFKKTLRKIAFKALKATVKGVIACVIYFVLWMFFAPFSAVIPGLQQIVEAFVIVYVILIILGELTSGTIFQYFFNAAKALFVICYLILSLNGGIYGLTFKNINLIVDLRIILTIAILLGLLGFAKSVFQAINYLNERTEYARI